MLFIQMWRFTSYYCYLQLFSICYLFFLIFSKKTLSSTFPLYKVKENSLVDKLIKNNLVLNRNKVLRARKRKQMCTVFKLEFCVSFLNDPLWTLIKKKKSYCLMIVVATVEHHTSQSSAFQEIEALILLVFVFSFIFPNFLRNFWNLKTRHFHCFNSNLFYCKRFPFTTCGLLGITVTQE